MKFPQISLVFLAAFLSFFSISWAGSDATPAAPFGVEMGTPGSCELLQKKIQAIDPAIQRVPMPGNVPDAWIFVPADRAYPGAKGISTVCVNNRTWLFSMNISRGDDDVGLKAALLGLESKYRSFGEDYKVFKQGNRAYSAKDVGISLDASKDGKTFLVRYEYRGLLDDKQIEAQIEKRKREDETFRKRTDPL